VDIQQMSSVKCRIMSVEGCFQIPLQVACLSCSRALRSPALLACTKYIPLLAGNVSECLESFEVSSLSLHCKIMRAKMSQVFKVPEI
jgi:hypothetical protein